MCNPRTAHKNKKDLLRRHARVLQSVSHPLATRGGGEADLGERAGGELRDGEELGSALTGGQYDFTVTAQLSFLVGIIVIIVANVCVPKKAKHN